MQVLDEILEEIEQRVNYYKEHATLEYVDICAGLREAEGIIRKHMNDGWMPVEKKLPLNAKYKGALCPRYQLNTKYGVTEGWYNPDFESWYVLIWFTTERYIECDIDFERGSYPKIVRCENKVNDKNSIVTAWRPLPEAYLPERNG